MLYGWPKKTLKTVFWQFLHPGFKYRYIKGNPVHKMMLGGKFAPGMWQKVMGWYGTKPWSSSVLFLMNSPRKSRQRNPRMNPEGSWRNILKAFRGLFWNLTVINIILLEETHRKNWWTWPPQKWWIKRLGMLVNGTYKQNLTNYY